MIFRFLVGLLLTAGVSAQGADELPFSPQDGETVVFLGDSITYQGLYSQYLETFFVTRYPERAIRFHNAGIAGDTVGQALDRFEADVAAHDPDYVTICFGMNDGGYEPFSAERFAAYAEGVAALLERIEALGAKAIVLSPTLFDHEMHLRRSEDPDYRFREGERDANYNALMAYYGGWSLLEAGRRGASYVDLWGPMNRHLLAGRREDPAFTLTPDAIHPSPAGHVIMAYEILCQLGVESSRAGGVTVFPQGERFVGRGGKVTGLEVNEARTEVRFTHRAEALPWLVPEIHMAEDERWKNPPDGRVGFAMTKAGHRLSGFPVRIAGLAPGTYEIRIDGQSIGSWSHLVLERKIEIQENEAAPQVQQSIRVAELNRARTDEAVRPAREVWAKRKVLMRTHGSNGEALEQAWAEASLPLADLEAKAAAMWETVREAAQPREHRFEILPVESEPGA